MANKLTTISVAFFFFLGLFSCSDSSQKELTQEKVLSIEDINGQWTLVRIDTISAKQSIEVNEYYNSIGVEYEISLIEPVGGILKCVSLCPVDTPQKDIEFANDSVFEYVFPIRLRASQEIRVVNNQIEFTRGSTSTWSNKEWQTEIAVSLHLDTLRLSYLEETGLYLSEVYQRVDFDNELVDLLRAYSYNLPYAHGKYTLVKYVYEPVDYDSPFEYYHSFPHVVPDTLDLSEADLLKVLQNNDEIQMLTDGELKPYELSWGWGSGFWITPKDWYVGADTSGMILYHKVE